MKCKLMNVECPHSQNGWCKVIPGKNFQIAHLNGCPEQCSHIEEEINVQKVEFTNDINLLEQYTTEALLIELLKRNRKKVK